MPIYLKDKLNTKEKIEKYCRETLHYENPRVLYEKIKMNSLLKVNGFYLYLTGRTGKQLKVCNAVQLVLSFENQQYIKLITSKSAQNLSDEEYKKFKDISKEKNILVYDELIKKHTESIYKNRPNPIGNTLIKGKEIFNNLTINKQIYVLLQILQISQLVNNGVDLSDIGGSKHSGVSLLNKKIDGLIELKLINQSVTGIYQKEIDLLNL